MRNKIMLFFVIVILTSCGSKHKMPEGVIPKEKMIEIMVDFQLVESAVLQKQNHQKDIKFYTNYYYDSILKKHKISRKEFNTSMEWYKNDMEGMDKMYREVLGRLSKMQPTVRK